MRPERTFATPSLLTTKKIRSIQTLLMCFRLAIPKLFEIWRWFGDRASSRAWQNAISVRGFQNRQHVKWHISRSKVRINLRIFAISVNRLFFMSVQSTLIIHRMQKAFSDLTRFTNRAKHHFQSTEIDRQYFYFYYSLKGIYNHCI